ncbi:metallophosphatase family protein [Sporosarcina aquimarina]|uniref:metallophosphoesterase family protein n=1 Tax=Sporosarcina aquimarina TaxID=114975 RepID=UPI00203D55C1|nr:metallophosphoesterase family protein [Sporosarcina aquimarina]MCM3759000.1 metallophosphatase family protein [Sporosarcina aquimarina]
MRVGLIADIHGNAPALRAVLQDLDKRLDIDQIFCLGDMIGIGPDTNEVLEILFSRTDISMITGNHDEAVLALLKDEEHPRSHSHAREHHQWIADTMEDRFISKLDQLPRTIHQNINRQRVLFTHYHIENSKRLDHISLDPFSNIVEPTLENLTSLYQDSEAELICFGHHHPLHFFESKTTTYLNPGSLGCNSKPIAPYTIVDILQNQIRVSFEEVSYDNTSFLSSYDLLQVPDREFILKAFHGNQRVKF